MDTDTLRRLVSDRIRALGLQKQEVARRAGISREMLYKFTAGDSDLGVSHALSLLTVLGLRVQVIPDFEPLPKDHRERKTRQQRAYLARAGTEAASGIGRGAAIGAVVVPELGDDW